MIWILLIVYCFFLGISKQMQRHDEQKPKYTKPLNHPFVRHTPFAQALLKLHTSQYPLVTISLFSMAETVKTWVAFENSYIHSLVVHALEQETMMLAGNRRTMSAIVKQLEEMNSLKN